MGTALRSKWVGVMAVAVMIGCGPSRPVLDTDASAPRDSSAPGNDTGVPGVDSAVPGNDAAVSPGSCSSGGGCDLLSATSCPDMGTTRQACYPGEGMTQCAPAGSVGAGGACASLNDCDTGLVCLDTGTCVPVCCSNTDCELGAMCRPLTGAGGTVGVCIRPTSCTPVPNSCPAGAQCQVLDSDGTTDCGGIGTNAEGATCGGGSGGCAEGLGCYGMAGGTAQCYRFCRIRMDADCTGGGTCTASGLGDTFGLCMGG